MQCENFSLCFYNTWLVQIVQEGSVAATKLEPALRLDPCAYGAMVQIDNGWQWLSNLNSMTTPLCRERERRVDVQQEWLSRIQNDGSIMQYNGRSEDILTCQCVREFPGLASTWVTRSDTMLTWKLQFTCLLSTGQPRPQTDLQIGLARQPFINEDVTCFDFGLFVVYLLHEGGKGCSCSGMLWSMSFVS